MYAQGGFWDDRSMEREHCFRVTPLEISGTDRMVREGFNVIYQALGILGYRFRDAGHNSKYAVVSLNKPISPRHIKELKDRFLIVPDSGTELAFA
jgi:hypothetical protein